MITVRACRQGNGIAVCAEGHANFAPHGQDIVCAGASALLYGYHAFLTALPSVRELPSVSAGRGALRAGDSGLFLYEDVEADRFAVISQNLNGEDERAWRVISEGLRLLAEAYPENVCLLDEVQGTGAAASASLYEHEKGGECV